MDGPLAGGLLYDWGGDGDRGTDCGRGPSLALLMARPTEARL